MISDEELMKYANEAITEQYIRGFEKNILEVLKFRQEQYPSEKNNDAWLDYSDFIMKRRGYID